MAIRSEAIKRFEVFLNFNILWNVQRLVLEISTIIAHKRPASFNFVKR
jgi:hypothetical protein